MANKAKAAKTRTRSASKATRRRPAPSGGEGLRDLSDISREWQRWIAVSLLNATPIAKVVAKMVEAGIDESEAAAACALVLADPTFEAGEWAMHRLNKLESVLAMRQLMESLAERTEVERRSKLSRRKFRDDYYARNQPVVLSDVCDHWPARSRWTPAYLAEVLGSAEVEVMTGREADAEYELNSHEHRTRLPFDEYVAKVTATEWSNDCYLVANNQLLATEPAAPLWAEFALDRRYLVPDERHNHTFLWFGPAGTITPLHHDVMNVLFHQVVGRKRFILLSPLDTPLVSNSVGVYSEVDPKAPDLKRHPRYARARPFQVTLEPGEALFIPAGWWHHVEALDLAISVSSTSFAFPNEIAWSNPPRRG